jgi:hypothetical protein
VRAVVRGFHSRDIDDLDGHLPADSSRFGFLLQIFVGPADGPGEESLDLVVCTLEWFSEERRREEPILGMNTLFVREYNWHKIRRFVERKVESSVGEAWEEIMTRLARMAHWEFEDYR